MKFLLLSSLLVATAAAASLPSPEVTQEVPQQHCVEKVPEGEDPSKYEICRVHPEGHDSPEPAVDVSLAAARKQKQTPEEIAAECGDLGVMEVPEGEDPANYRKCRDHPAANRASPDSIEDEDVEQRKRNTNIELAKRGQSAANELVARSEKFKLKQRACWYGSQLYDCYKTGWCYSYCGRIDSGKWCWLAVNNGKGDWARCGSRAQCDWKKFNLDCGGRCACW